MIQMAETSRGLVVSIGPFAEHNVGHYRSEGGTALTPAVPWDTTGADSTPMRTLCWRSRYVPLAGRDDDTRALLEWARSGPAARARVLVGEAGSGKTRLAAEVAETLQQEGWSAGFARWSAGQVWQVGDAGVLLILDDPFDAEGRCWEDVERAVKATAAETTPLRILVIARDRWRWSIDPDDACSIQELNALSVDDATIVHDAALARYAPERPVPRPKRRFAEWAVSDPTVRLLPLYTIASAISLGHPPWDTAYPAMTRRTIVGLAQATHNRFNEQGEQVGLVPGVVPLVAALAEVCGGLDEADLRRLALRTALTESDADEFVMRVTRLPAWRQGRLHDCGDGLVRAEFVRLELHDAIERGHGLRVDAVLHRAHLWQMAQLDRILSDAHASADVCDRLAREVRLADGRWLVHLNVDPKAGSFLGRLALRTAQREAPPLPVAVRDPATNDERARQLVTLARQQRREGGATAAVDAAEGAATLYRALARKSDAYESNLFDALRVLGECLQETKSARTGRVWKEWVAQARRSGDESDLLLALWTLGECELAAEADRIEAVRELEQIYLEAGRAAHHALALEYLALLVPLDEAVSLVHAAARIRVDLEPEGQVFNGSDILERLFLRLKEADSGAALAVAQLQVVANRARKPLDTSLTRLTVPLHIAESLENVAAVADAFEAREALREALELFRGVWEGTGRRFGSSRVQRVEEKLRELESRS